MTSECGKKPKPYSYVLPGAEIVIKMYYAKSRRDGWKLVTNHKLETPLPVRYINQHYSQGYVF